jgi:DNA processing protein
VRNRVLAALAEVVVVVESHAKGGSLHTVEAALARDRPVMAVPGSVRSPASDLPNALLADGCAPVRDALDVLVALGLSTGGPGVPGPNAVAGLRGPNAVAGLRGPNAVAGAATERRPTPGGDAGAVLAAAGWEPVSLDDIVARTGLSPGAVSLALTRLEDERWVEGSAGWWERVPDRVMGDIR